ncbi:MAG TPA: hypothetical protein VH021_16105 [Trebonia sp.]|nr:hypothetical protein [Trebonia sp.]
MPSPRITSAWRVARLACSVPLRPLAPRYRSPDEPGARSFPAGELTTGTRAAAAKAASSAAKAAVSAGLDCPSAAPWPTTITGRSAATSISIARATSSAAAADRGGDPGSARSASEASGTVSANTFSGTSRFTGPGRPDSITS